jgi:hypothetical protein
MRLIAILFLMFAAVSAAAAPDLAGRYAGEWKSNSAGGGGAFRLSLESGTGGWKCDVVFAYAGQDVKTVTKEVKVDGSKLDVSYDFDLAGNALRSHVTGELNGKSFEGKYQTTTVDGSAAVDDGTWNAARAN